MNDVERGDEMYSTWCRDFFMLMGYEYLTIMNNEKYDEDLEKWRATLCPIFVTTFEDFSPS